MSIILLINYSLHLSSRFVCVFPIFNIYCLLFYAVYIFKSVPPRLAMLFAVCSYIVFISICVCVNKLNFFDVTQRCLQIVNLVVHYE